MVMMLVMERIIGISWRHRTGPIRDKDSRFLACYDSDLVSALAASAIPVFTFVDYQIGSFSVVTVFLKRSQRRIVCSDYDRHRAGEATV
jgi:hypothetical protein